jgi:hypothetical protein
MFELTPTVATAATDAANALMTGPPGGLPGPVPDFVSELLGTVGSFLDGGVENLGESVSGIVPGGESSAPPAGAGDGGGPPS